MPLFSLILALLLTMAGASRAADSAAAPGSPEGCRSLPKPAALKLKIDAAPDHSSFLRIFEMTPSSRPSPAWTCFVTKVERADESLGPALLALAKKPYWLAATDVKEALSRALIVRPAFVLKIIGASSNPGRASNAICRIEMPYGVTAREMDAAHRQAYTALGRVADDGLARPRQSCFESLAAHLRQSKDLRRLAGDAPAY